MPHWSIPSLPVAHLQSYASHSIVTWNLRGLLCANLKLRARKLQALLQISKSHSVVCLQEVHGSHEKISIAFSRFQSLFHVFISAPEVDQVCDTAVGVEGNISCSAGGNVMLLLRDHFRGWEFAHTSLVTGRAHFIHAKHIGIYNTISTYYHNIHNHDLTMGQVRHVTSHVSLHVNLSKSEPQLTATVVTGDFNIPPSGEIPLPLDNPHRLVDLDPSMVPAAQRNTRRFQAIWEEMFAKLTEIRSSEHTHINISALTTNTLDRIFHTVSHSALLCLDHSVGVHDPPASWYARNVSDHAPRFWTFSFKKPRGSMKPRLTARYCKHPMYLQLCNTMLEDLDMSHMHVHDRVSLCKVVFEHVHRHVRDHCLAHEGDKIENSLTILASISRAIWQKNIVLARRLIGKFSVAARFLRISPLGPVCTDPVGFESAFREAKVQQIEQNKRQLLREDADAEAAGAARKNRSRLSVLERQASLWRPKAPYLALAGVKVAHCSGDGTVETQVLSTPDSMCEALRLGWLPIFKNHGCNKKLARSFLRKYVKHVSWQWNLSPPPPWRR